VTLDYPVGGSGALVDALVRGIEKHSPSQVYVNAHVQEILVNDNGTKVVGVRLSTGQVVHVRTAVVSNADPFVTNQLLLTNASTNLSDKTRQYMNSLVNTDKSTGGIQVLKSFIHLHAGIDGTGLPDQPSADFPTQWAVIRDWDAPDGVEAPRNIVLCSMPSLIDPSMAPPGKHVLHAYVPATEPYHWWSGLDRQSEEYLKKKEEAADFLWNAIEEYIPNARDRAVPGTVQIGTPLTHERFLRRTRGTYGPRVDVGAKQKLSGHIVPG
jgi:phytoene dehydrogenase-like protein